MRAVSSVISENTKDHIVIVKVKRADPQGSWGRDQWGAFLELRHSAHFPGEKGNVSCGGRAGDSGSGYQVVSGGLGLCTAPRVSPLSLSRSEELLSAWVLPG